MPWRHLALTALGPAALTAACAILLLLPAGPSSAPERSFDSLRPAPSPPAPRAEPPEFFGVDPSRMLLYSEEQLRRDTAPELPRELRQIDPRPIPLISP